MSKSLITNLIAVLITSIGIISPYYKEYIFSVGLFSLSGALTNWIAVHMLFEKIPFLYGSGVIQNRFEDFKLGIKNLIIKEFFNKDQLNKFLISSSALSPDSIIDSLDTDKIFNDLAETIMQSSFGSMLGMFGGKKSLEPLKQPMEVKIKEIILEIIQKKSNGFEGQDAILKKIEVIIDDRLNQLTPRMVKNIMQKMIKNHLGWLVVWGGVFGGIIGFVYAILSN